MKYHSIWRLKAILIFFCCTEINTENPSNSNLLLTLKERLHGFFGLQNDKSQSSMENEDVNIINYNKNDGTVLQSTNDLDTDKKDANIKYYNKKINAVLSVQDDIESITSIEAEKIDPSIHQSYQKNGKELSY